MAETERIPVDFHQAMFRIAAIAFVTSATPHGGNEQALQSILTLFMHLGMLVVTPGQSEPILEHPAAPYGATAVTGAKIHRGTLTASLFRPGQLQGDGLTGGGAAGAVGVVAIQPHGHEHQDPDPDDPEDYEAAHRQFTGCLSAA